jgi:hypothetical protein
MVENRHVPKAHATIFFWRTYPTPMPPMQFVFAIFSSPQKLEMGLPIFSQIEIVISKQLMTKVRMACATLLWRASLPAWETGWLDQLFRYCHKRLQRKLKQLVGDLKT